MKKLLKGLMIFAVLAAVVGCSNEAKKETGEVANYVMISDRTVSEVQLHYTDEAVSKQVTVDANALNGLEEEEVEEITAVFNTLQEKYQGTEGVVYTVEVIEDLATVTFEVDYTVVSDETVTQLLEDGLVYATDGIATTFDVQNAAIEAAGYNKKQ